MRPRQESERTAPGTRPPTAEEIRQRAEREKRRKMAAPKPERPEPGQEDPIDEASDESFPASDPPAHGGGRRP